MIAWTAYLIAWVVPTMDVLFAGVVPGWEAFLILLAQIVHPSGLFRGAMGLEALLANILVLLSFAMFRRPRIPKWFAISLAVAFALNLIPAYRSNPPLLVGYWLWVGSMGLLATVAFLSRRRQAAYVRAKIQASSAP